MLDSSESETLTTDSFRVVGLRSPSHGTKMIPRRLMLCVKIAVVVIAVTLVLIIVTNLARGSSVFTMSNFVSGPVPDSADETFQDGLRVGNMHFDQFTNSMLFKPVGGGKPYVTFAFKSNHVFKSAKMKLDIECINKSSTGGREEGEGKRVLCLQFDNINLAAYAEKRSALDCHVIHIGEQKNIDEMKSKESKVVVNQCIDLKENWYGGGALSEHRWPLNRVNVTMQPYITKKFNLVNSDSSKGGGAVHFESFLEPYFVSASGIAIVFDPFLPLFVSMNDHYDKKLCFKSEFRDPYDFGKSTLADRTLSKFTICKDRLAKDVHKRLLKSKTLNRPLSLPSTDILQKPIWSTRGIDVKNINEMQTLMYINSLKNSHLNFSQLVIDGNYSRSPGSVYFDEKRFPHSAQQAMELDTALPHEKLKLSTEVFPLIPKFMTYKNFSYSNPSIRFDKEMKELESFLLDLSNRKAVDWFVSQLDTIVSQVKVKGFRFSGGHAATVLDQTRNVIKNHSNGMAMHPNQVTHEYGKIAGKFQGNSLLGSGYQSQSLGLVADAGPFLASWSHHKGLKSLIPTVITYGIMGYPFVSAGPIGGIDLHLNSTSDHFSLSDRNLYLRWLQLATFLPVMEFSVGPWQYDEAVVNMTRNLMSYRQNEIWPNFILPAIRETSETGVPIVRPLWWVAPLDTTAQFIDCEFLVGDDLLVAPVLEARAVSRQVYLPFGSAWRDLLRGGQVYQGGRWLTNYPVGQYEIAHFLRVTAENRKSSKSSS